jgi:hypothetical protein
VTTNSTDTLERPRRSEQTTPTSTSSPLRDPFVPEATIGKRRPWSAWQDWVNIGLGAYLALAPLWTTGAPIGWFATLGVLAIAVGIWAGSTSSSTVAEWTQMIVGAIIILSPLFGNYGAAISATWTAWTVGALLIALAATAMHQNRSGRPAKHRHR